MIRGRSGFGWLDFILGLLLILLGVLTFVYPDVALKRTRLECDSVPQRFQVPGRAF